MKLLANVDNLSVVIAALSLCGVLAYLLRDNTTQLWKAVGQLTQQNSTQAEQIKSLEAHADRLDDENTRLKVEVNDLCRELGRSPRYFVPVPESTARPLRVNA